MKFNPAMHPAKYSFLIFAILILSFKNTNTYAIPFKHPSSSITVSAVSIDVSAEVYNGSTLLLYDGSIRATASGGIAPYTYSLQILNYQQNNGYFPGLSPGTYTVIATDATGQTASAIVTVNYKYLQPTVTASNIVAPTSCDGTNGSFTLTGSGGTSPYTFSIDGGNTYSANTTYTGLVLGIYQVLVKDAKGQIAMIHENPPTQNIEGAVFLLCKNCYCAGGANNDVARCSANGYMHVVDYSYTASVAFSFDGSNYVSMLPNTVYPNIFYYDSTGLSPGLYKVYLKDAAGAISIFTAIIAKYCFLQIDFVGADATCGQHDGSLTVQAANGFTPYTYTIDGINYQASNVFTGLSPGIYSVTVKDAMGQTSSSTSTVFDNCPTVTAVGAIGNCGQNSGTITATGTRGKQPYQFSIDGVHFQAGNSFTGLSAGSYTIILKDANGFTATVTVALTDNCLQQVLTDTNSTCGQQNGSITATASKGTAPYQYSIDGINFQTSNQFNNLATGNYTITAKDAGGLIAVSMTAITDAPSPQLTATTTPASCNNTNGSATLSTNGGTPPFQYSIDNGNTYQAFNIFNDVDSGQYIALVTDANGCNARDTIQVTALSAPIFSIGNDTTICEGQTLLLSAPIYPGYQYNWQDNSSGNQFMVTVPGKYILKVANAFGCAASDSIQVSYQTAPVFSIGSDTSVCITQTITLNAFYPQSSYLWQDGSTQAIYQVASAGKYAVAVTNICGVTKDSIEVAFENCACKFYMPSAFTPDHNGRNDIFLPKYQCLFSNYKLTIFNRWGQVVFASGNVSIGWDGTCNGRDQPTGTYVWELSYTDNLTGKITHRNGTLILIR